MAATALTNTVNAFSAVIVNPLLALLFGVGLIVFIYGVVEFFFEFNVRGNQSSKEAGKNHMLWGLVGMFIMLSAWAILKLIAGTVGATLPTTLPPGGGGGGSGFGNQML